MNKIIAIIFFSLFCLLVSAQDMNLFYRLVSEGDYERAETVLEGINIINSGKYDSELKKVSSCVRLKQDALKKYRQEHFTEAIRCFELIRNYFPSPVIDSWIKKCEQARDEYLRRKEAERKEKERQEKIVRAKAEEEAKWNSALVSDELDGYLDYLSSYPFGNHRQEARENIFYEYCTSAYGCYLDKAYSDAVIYYEKAMLYGRLSSSQKSTYESCKEKISEANEKRIFENLMNLMNQSMQASTIKKENIIHQCNQFLKTYPKGKYSPQVRGELVQLYCSIGSFSSALDIVEQYPQSVALTETFTPDLSWWKKYIKHREKQYDKKKSYKPVARSGQLQYRKSTTIFDDLGIMFGVGGQATFMQYKAMTEPKYAQGVYYSPEEETVGGVFLGPKLTFSLGDFYNRFNLEVGFSYAYSGEFGSQMPLTLAPRWNIIANDFHLYVQPEIGYDLLRGGMYYGGRVGCGGTYIGSISFAPMYNTSFGHMLWQLSYIWYWAW